jgi:hypothetical protein
MAIITTSQVFRSLKQTLDEILTDPTEDPKRDLIYPMYMEVKTMSDNYVDDAEIAGTLLLQDKPEGQNAAVGTIQEGGTKRYTARTQALHLHIAEEAIEDSKYDKYINAAARLVKSAYKTQDIDATNVLVRSTNATFPGGLDNLTLGNSAHTLPYGGTWSNIADVYQTPSRAAVIAATTKIRKYPSQNGIVEGFTPKKIVCPMAQWAVWEGILGSQLVPESNNNEINVVKTLGLKVVPVKYWDAASTTAWGIVTDSDGGLQWRNRRPLKRRTWVDNDAEVMKFGVSYREAHGWSDPRGWFQGNV